MNIYQIIGPLSALVIVGALVYSYKVTKKD